MADRYSPEHPSFETVFVDENPEVINALASSFGRRWAGRVRFTVGNIFATGPGVLVSPTNSFGDMSAGIDLQLSAMFVSLQDRLQMYISRQPSKRLPIGSVVWAETGNEAYPLVIFSPTFRTALDMASSPTRIYRAAFAVFASVRSSASACPKMQKQSKVAIVGVAGAPDPTQRPT
jgi:hypothetical protein